jgi:hypothetical protein
MNEKFLKLTNAVYKVLEFFPESDPLKNRAKDKALIIMDSLILVNENSGWASFQKEKIKVQLLEDIEILLGYLWIGKTQKWLNSVNYIIIANEYEKIRNEMAPIVTPVIPDKSPEEYFDGELVGEPKLTDNPELDDKEGDILNGINIDLPVQTGRQSPPSHEVTARQSKIIEYLSKNEKAQVMDLQTVLPDITKRTIRRDLDDLLESGKVIRTGDFNQVSYQLKR